MPKVVRLIPIILVIIVFLVVTVSFIANIMFNQKVTKEVRELFNSKVENKNDIVRQEDLAGLPLCVQKWLENSQVVGKERIRTVRLKQKGLMRTKQDGSWMSVEAEQYFTVDEPGFIWKAKVKMAPLIYFAGRDKYSEGKGNMLIKVLSLITVVNGKGREMDQGTMLRYLAESAWFPTAALSNYIKWEEIDSHSARATMSYKGVTASGVFTFNEQGEVIRFAAKRYMESGGKYVLENWSGVSTDYKDFNGIRIPTKTDVFWNLKTGDFNWYKCEITEIEYNKPLLY